MLRPDYFDSLGRPHNPQFSSLQPVEYSDVRQPPAGSFSSIVNRESEYLAKQARRQLRPYHNPNVDLANQIMSEVKLFGNHSPRSHEKQLIPVTQKFNDLSNLEFKSSHSLQKVRENSPKNGPIQNDYQLDEQRRQQHPQLNSQSSILKPNSNIQSESKNVDFQLPNLNRNKEIQLYRQTNQIPSPRVSSVDDPSNFHNPHNELIVVGQVDHQNHQYKQRMQPHPKQDHGMETGSLVPLPIPTSNHYLRDAPDLPTEESRKVLFSKRLSLPNHYTQQTPQSQLQNTGAQIIVKYQNPQVYQSISSALQQKNQEIADQQYNFQNQGRVGQERANFLKSRFYQ